MSGTNPSDGMVGEAVSDTGQGREPIGQDEGHRPGRGAEAHVAAPQLRLLAFAIDLVVVACVLGPTFVVDRYTTLPSVVVYLGGAGVFLYYVSMTTWLMHGQTAGKVVCGLAVRRVHGGAPPRSSPGLLWSVGRHSVGYVVTDVLGLGTALALVTPRRRCLHDYAFGSEVVMVERVQTPRAYWDRYRAFWKPFKEAYEEIQERYVWLFFPWKWLTKAFGVIAALLLAFRPTAASASTTPAGPAPAAASKVGMATVWAGTTVTTVALVKHFVAARGARHRRHLGPRPGGDGQPRRLRPSGVRGPVADLRACGRGAGRHRGAGLPCRHGARASTHRR